MGEMYTQWLMSSLNLFKWSDSLSTPQLVKAFKEFNYRSNLYIAVLHSLKKRIDVPQELKLIVLLEELK